MYQIMRLRLILACLAHLNKTSLMQWLQLIFADVVLMKENQLESLVNGKTRP